MAAGASHLNSSKLNLGILREFYRREFLESIDKCIGTKALVWDDGLTGPFGLIAEASLLKMFYFCAGILDQGAGVLIVFEDSPSDKTYANALETIHNMSKVVDALYQKIKKLT